MQMREQILRPDRSVKAASAKDYEYLVLSVDPHESLPDARRLISNHAEYGKWELQRTRIYRGGQHRYWLRRKIMRVQRTI
jgi:hypothetical protein